MSVHKGPAFGSRLTPPPVELFATLGLALSTLIAVTAVSIGIARADVPMPTGLKNTPSIVSSDHTR